MDYFRKPAGWYLGISLVMLIISFMVICKAFPYTGDLPENAPPLVYTVTLIVAMLAVVIVRYSRYLSLSAVRWSLVAAAVVFAMLPSFFPKMALYAVTADSDLLAGLLLLSGWVLRGGDNKTSLRDKTLLMTSSIVVTGMSVSHGNLGLVLVCILLAVLLLGLQQQRLAGLLLLGSTIAFLTVAIAAKPYRLHYVQRILTHSEPGSPHYLALQALQSGGLTGSTPTIPTTESAAQVCIDTAPPFEQLLCQSNNSEFVFAVIGAWYGLTGIALLLVSFLLLAVLIIRSVRKTEQQTASLLLGIWGGAVILLAGLHMLYTIGLFFWPIPLPFFNGSLPVILIICIAVGIMGHIQQKHA